MSKRIVFAIVFLVVLCFFTRHSHAYTVILKNGKTMTGKLESETNDAIVFVDDSGVRFSLKKSGLDLDKMKAANEATETDKADETATVPETMEVPPAAAPRSEKKGRVYTNEDVDRLKEKYGEMTTGIPVENPEDFSSPGVLKPEAYLRNVQKTVTQFTQLQQNLDVLGSGVSTQWEVAASTGKNAGQAIQTYLKGESATGIIEGCNAGISALQDTRRSLGTAPGGFEPLAKNFDSALAAVQSYFDFIRGYAQIQNSSLFRSRLDNLRAELSSQIQNLQNWQPPFPVNQQQTSSTESQ